VARQAAGRGSAGDSDAGIDERGPRDSGSGPHGDDVEAASRSAQTEALWEEVRVAPVEIALPSGVGYTLRAYRLSTELAEPEFVDEEDEFAALRGGPATVEEDADEPEIDEDELAELALAAGGGKRATKSRDDDEEEPDADSDSDVDDADELEDADEESDDEDDEGEDGDDEEPEEVPVFLAHQGKLLLFRSTDGLVEFIRSDEEHDLTQLDTWAQVRERITLDDVVPLYEDRYELDLVVGNLRGGHDAWNPTLLIQAGEVSRDLAYALRLQQVITALAPGSPLDDLDEGLRRTESGGFGAFFARRRVRKIDPQTTAALGWRTIIGKISAAVDWRN
jgi:hypothetical protein